MATAPLVLGGTSTWAFSLSAAVMAVSFVSYWLEAVRGRKPLRKTGLEPWFLAYAVFLAMSWHHSVVRPLGGPEAFKTAAAALYFFSAVAYVQDRDRLYRLMTVFFWTAAALSVFGLFQYLGALPRPWWFHSHFLSSTFVNHNHFAGFLEIAVLFSLALVLAERDAAKKPLEIFLCVLMATAFVFTLSRGGYVSMLVGMAVMVWALFSRGAVRKPVWIYAVFFTLLAGALFFFGTEAIGQRLRLVAESGLTEDVSFSQRMAIWKGALALIGSSPWFGTGPGTFGWLFLTSRPQEFVFRAGAAHNDILHAWADCGVFATAAFIGFYIALMLKVRSVVRDESRLRSSAAAAGLGFLSALAVHSLVDFNLHIPGNIAWFMTASGIVAALPQEKKLFNGIWKPCAFIATGVLTLAVLAGAVYYGVSDYFLWRGKVQMKAGRPDAATALFSESLRVRSNNPETYYQRGLARLESGDKRGAFQDLEKAVTLNPFEPYYSLHLARAASAAGTGTAELPALYEQVLKKDPKDPALYFSCGRDLMKLSASAPELFTPAEAMLTRAVTLDPQRAEAVYQILWGRTKSAAVLERFHASAPSGLAGLLRFLEKRQLWQYHRRFYRESVGLPSDEKTGAEAWNQRSEDAYVLNDFRPEDGKPMNLNDFFYRGGRLEKEVVLRGSHGRVVLSARGVSVAGAFPYLILTLNGRPVDAVYVDSLGFRNYYCIFRDARPGRAVFGIEFKNDYSDKRSKADRNAWVRGVQFQYPASTD